jgi:hypothetical protein
MATKIDSAVVKKGIIRLCKDFMCVAVAVRLINPLPGYD